MQKTLQYRRNQDMQLPKTPILKGPTKTQFLSKTSIHFLKCQIVQLPQKHQNPQSNSRSQGAMTEEKMR